MEKALLEIYSYNRRLEALMKNNYRELAMAKTHVEYWWHCHLTENSNLKPKYYDEHLSSQITAREIERKLGETKAEFIGHVRKFQALKKIKPEIEKELEVISDLSNARAKSYDASISHNKIRNELVIADEKELRENYYKNLDYFKNINDYLYSLIKPK